MANDFDISAVARNLQRGNEREREHAEHRKLSARAEGERLAAEIRKVDPSVHAVLGFGSTYEEGRPYRLDSDIDLAIEGGDLLLAIRVVSQSPFKVDVVDISEHDAFSVMVRERGTRLA